MKDFELGRSAVHSIMTGLANESATFRHGYASGLKAYRVLPALFGIDDTKSVPDDEDDPDGYALGVAAARAERRQLSEQSDEFKAGFAFELQLPIEVHAKALAIDAEVAKRVSQKMAVHRRADDMLRDMKAGAVPRSLEQDRRELAFIAAYREKKAIKDRADQIVQEHRIAKGEGEFVIEKGGDIVPARPELIAARIREVRADIRNAKDFDNPDFETKDCY